MLEAVVINSILWRDAAVSGGNEIHNTGNMLISYSNIAGSGGSGAGWNTSLGTDGGNNIGEDPRFVNAGSPLGADGIPATNDDGLRLTQFSDAVNAGNNLAPGLADISEDYIGALRVLGGTVDMGAYERSGFILPKLDFVWVLNWRGIELHVFRVRFHGLSCCFGNLALTLILRGKNPRNSSNRVIQL